MGYELHRNKTWFDRVMAVLVFLHLNLSARNFDGGSRCSAQGTATPSNCAVWMKSCHCFTAASELMQRTLNHDLTKRVTVDLLPLTFVQRNDARSMFKKINEITESKYTHLFGDFWRHWCIINFPLGCKTCVEYGNDIYMHSNTNSKTQYFFNRGYLCCSSLRLTLPVPHLGSSLGKTPSCPCPLRILTCVPPNMLLKILLRYSPNLFLEFDGIFWRPTLAPRPQLIAIGSHCGRFSDLIWSIDVSM